MIQISKKLQIIKKIEESNYAEIYKVKDPHHDCSILKIARTKNADFNELISREFQILSQLKHPNIVTVYDYDINDKGRAYFTSEFISGEPINKFFKNWSEDFISAAIQVLNALATFHNKGFIHTDLKPEHILYNPAEKKAVLIDFGFAIVPSRETKFFGTMDYIAPEVLKGIGIDQRSDLYSLGIIIYEILSSKKPAEIYIPITDIPEEMNVILDHLLSIEPARRPTILDLHRQFSKYLPSAKITVPAYEVRLPTTYFIEIPEFTEKMSSTKGTALIVCGNIGAGKTRLLKELKFKFLLKGYSVMLYIPGEGINFHESICNFINYKEFNPSDKEEKFQVYEEILEELIKFSKNKDVVIMVDDLEELNDYELGLFRYIGYGIINSNILLLSTSKSDERIKSLDFDILQLRPFTIEETRQLLEETFFEMEMIEKDNAIKIEDFTQWLHKQSGGNPLLIVELLKMLHEYKVLYYQTGRWQIRSNLLKDINIPTELKGLFSMRINHLNNEAQNILKILSICGHALPPSIIALITKSTTNLEHLKISGLLREEVVDDKRVVVISNQILSNIIEEQIDPNERKSLCEQTINAIESFSPGEKTYAPILARLGEGTDKLDKAQKYYLISAESVERIYDYELAIKYYEKVVEYSKCVNPEMYPEFLLKLADLNQIVGNNKSAIEFYDKALKTEDKNLQSKIYFGMGKAYSTMDQHSAAIEYLKKSLDFIKEGREHIEIENRIAYSLLYLNRFEEAETILNNSLSKSEKIKDSEIFAETLYYRSVLEWFRSNFEKGINIAKELLKFCEKNRLSKKYAFCANLLSSFYLQKGDIENGNYYIDLSIDGFKKTKQISALCAATNNKALLMYNYGDINRARRLYELALIQSRQTGNQITLYSALGSLANISEDLGQFEKAIVYNEQALGIKSDSPYINYNLAMVFYKKGEIDRARSILEKRINIKEEIPYYFGLGTINLVLGKVSRAEELLNQGLKMVETKNPDISTRIESFLRATQFYYEIRNFEKSLNHAEKIKEISYKGSHKYSIANCFIKINNFRLKKSSTIDIDDETKNLKDKGFIYDYAYLKKIAIESMIDCGIKQDEIKKILDELIVIGNIFHHLGAELELNRVQKILWRISSIISNDYSKRIISSEYLTIFSKLAELIHRHLGDENFVKELMDLIIDSTGAERGALFIKTKKGMEFFTGRNMDHTTIKDAGELSRTAIEEIEKNPVVFIQDALSDPKFNIRKSIMLNQIRSILCIPLSVSEIIVGAIYLDSRVTSSVFGPHDKDFLSTTAKILASVIERSIIFQSMTEEFTLLKSNVVKEIASGYLIGRSKPMSRVYRLIEDVAPTLSPVLIVGETGTGKGMIARLLHLKSARKNKKFLTINCGTITETLLESELFGHKKGSFTDAISDKKGLLEEGEGGTVFLDEITNTSPEFQAKLLEAIEEKVVRRVGETQTRNIDVRFLFATNKDLEIEVEEGRFRRDLFYRVNVFKIEVPPLRERVSDIPLLAQFFLERCSKDIGKRIDGFTTEAIQKLKDYLWPGNVRELQNVIGRAAVLAKKRLITIEDLGLGPTSGDLIPLKVIKKEAILEALNATGWNVKKTAELLGIARNSLYRYLRKYGIKQ